MKVCLEKRLLSKIISTLKKIKGFKAAAKSVFLEPERGEEKGQEEEEEQKDDEIEVRKEKSKALEVQDEDAVTSRLRNKKEEKAGYEDDKEEGEGDEEGEKEAVKEVTEGGEEEGEDLRLMLQTSFLKEFMCFQRADGFSLPFLSVFSHTLTQVKALSLFFVSPLLLRRF